MEDDLIRRGAIGFAPLAGNAADPISTIAHAPGFDGVADQVVESGASRDAAKLALVGAGHGAQSGHSGLIRRAQGMNRVPRGGAERIVDEKGWHRSAPFETSELTI
jgi:hypothetical protein